MADFTGTRLWQETLASKSSNDPDVTARDRLRNTYFKFRDNAGHIAGEIARDLPDFTVHDVTHLDALWEMADLIAGPNFYLTPLEAFVLGGSFLIHDLGNGLAAYPDGLEALKTKLGWLDTIAALLRKRLGRTPTKIELENIDKEIEREATGEMLRNLHAKQAERLALISWKDRKNDKEYYLIEDSELRMRYGPIIGKIAHSHWWGVEKLEQEFTVQIGASPIGYPREWTVDPLKIASLLRVADASHIDARRAPSFLRALRKPSDYSKQHWIFQEHLHQPQLKDDRLIYTSGNAFSIEDAPSWWLCFDTLRMIDHELKQVDALLADLGRERFAARGVMGAEDPDRLVKWIPTDNWLPIDTQIKVTNVVNLVRNLGGEQLYGDNRVVPLRELIQNASDAVRARRIVDNREEDYGSIYVAIGKDSNGYWIEVEDNGIGMSTEVLKGPLLDFGTSFWGSNLMLKEFPGLLSKGFVSTGKYGIGFFSVFMWGHRVRVTSRPYKDAQRDTKVLEFNSGISSRPILRMADEVEFIRDGGTRVRIWLDQDPESFGGLFHSDDHDEKKTLKDVCKWLCPSIDVDLYVQRKSRKAKLIVAAQDWKEIEGHELFRRIENRRFKKNRRNKNILGDQISSELFQSLSNNLRFLRDESGKVVGRACISGRGLRDRGDYPGGVVTVGGFSSCDLSGITGILIGISGRAARDLGIPVVEKSELSRWASEQAELVCNLTQDPEILVECASFIKACDGNTGTLPVAEGAKGWLSVKDICAWNDAPNEIFLVQDAAIALERRKVNPLLLNSNVLAVGMGFPGVLQPGRVAHFVNWPEFPEGPLGFHQGTLEGAVVEALAKAWGTSLEEVIRVSEFSEDDKSLKREVGRGDGKFVVKNVDIIRNPNSIKEDK